MGDASYGGGQLEFRQASSRSRKLGLRQAGRQRSSVFLSAIADFLTKWDTTGGGAQVVAGAEGAEDLIPTNRWLKRVVLPGRVEFMRMPLGVGRRPRTGHEEGAREPTRFYVQIADQEDISMLIIPRKFRPVMKQWLVSGPPRFVSVSANKWCEFLVQVQMFKGHMVLGHGWEYFCRRHKIVPGDLVVFKLSGLGLKVQIYNSNICTVRCTKHSRVGDITQAL